MGQQAAALVGTVGRPRSFSRPQLALPASDRPVQPHPPAPAGPFWVRGPGKRSTGHALYFVTIQNIEGRPSRQGVNGSPEMGFGLFAALAAIGPAMERTASMSGVSMATGLPIPGACLGAWLVPAIAGLRQPAGMVRKRARSSPRKGTFGNALFGEPHVPWQSTLLSVPDADVCRSCAPGGGKRRAQGADLHMLSAGPCCLWI